jgi:hypothetical protein
METKKLFLGGLEMNKKEIKPHMLRVIEEKKELDTKIKALQIFLANEVEGVSNFLSKKVFGVRTTQLSHMIQYSESLKCILTLEGIE